MTERLHSRLRPLLMSETCFAREVDAAWSANSLELIHSTMRSGEDCVYGLCTSVFC